MDNKLFKNLFNSMRNGNKESFTCLYNELKKPVYTIIYRILLNIEDSEDVMQEVFYRLYKIAPETKVDNPRAYIFSMARNLAFDKYKERQRYENDELVEETIDEYNSLFADRIISKISLDEALAYISESGREIISLRINGNLKFREIAKMLNLPIGTVLTRYNSAIKALKKMLK